MSLLAQDIGTLGLLLLIATSIVIRARYFCTHGREAFFVVICYVSVTVPLRLVTTHALLTPDQSRLLAGFIAIGFSVLQVSVAWMAEMTLRVARQKEALAP